MGFTLRQHGENFYSPRRATPAPAAALRQAQAPAHTPQDYERMGEDYQQWGESNSALGALGRGVTSAAAYALPLGGALSADLAMGTYDAATGEGAMGVVDNLGATDRAIRDWGREIMPNYAVEMAQKYDDTSGEEKQGMAEAYNEYQDILGRLKETDPETPEYRRLSGELKNIAGKAIYGFAADWRDEAQRNARLFGGASMLALVNPLNITRFAATKGAKAAGKAAAEEGKTKTQKVVSIAGKGLDAAGVVSRNAIAAGGALSSAMMDAKTGAEAADNAQLVGGGAGLAADLLRGGVKGIAKGGIRWLGKQVDEAGDNIDNVAQNLAPVRGYEDSASPILNIADPAVNNPMGTAMEARNYTDAQSARLQSAAARNTEGGAKMAENYAKEASDRATLLKDTPRKMTEDEAANNLRRGLRAERKAQQATVRERYYAPLDDALSGHAVPKGDLRVPAQDILSKGLDELLEENSPVRKLIDGLPSGEKAEMARALGLPDDAKFVSYTTLAILRGRVSDAYRAAKATDNAREMRAAMSVQKRIDGIISEAIGGDKKLQGLYDNAKKAWGDVQKRFGGTKIRALMKGDASEADLLAKIKSGVGNADPAQALASFNELARALTPGKLIAKVGDQQKLQRGKPAISSGALESEMGENLMSIDGARRAAAAVSETMSAPQSARFYTKMYEKLESGDLPQTAIDAYEAALDVFGAGMMRGLGGVAKRTAEGGVRTTNFLHKMSAENLQAWKRGAERKLAKELGGNEDAAAKMINGIFVQGAFSQFLRAARNRKEGAPADTAQVEAAIAGLRNLTGKNDKLAAERFDVMFDDGGKMRLALDTLADMLEGGLKMSGKASAVRSIAPSDLSKAVHRSAAGALGATRHIWGVISAGGAAALSSVRFLRDHLKHADRNRYLANMEQNLGGKIVGGKPQYRLSVQRLLRAAGYMTKMMETGEPDQNDKTEK